jgi:hypothetical protein
VDNSTIFIMVAFLLFILLMFFSFKTSKSRKLKITLADNTVIEVTRKWNDGFNDIKDMKAYHDSDGKVLWIANHWMIKIEEM